MIPAARAGPVVQRDSSKVAPALSTVRRDAGFTLSSGDPGG